MKKIAVLLNGSIENDQRVIKTITTLSQVLKVDLFYINGRAHDKHFFNNNVRLFSIKKDNNFKIKIIQHTCFYNEFLFFKKHVLETKINYDYVWANDLPCLKPALQIKEKLNCQLIYDSHEIYIETLNQFFPQNTSFIKKIIFKTLLSFMRQRGTSFERKALKKTDFFITVGKQFKLYFEKKYNVKDVIVLMNCPKINTNYNITNNLKKQLGLKQSDVLFIYQGVLNYGRGLHLMIKSFQNVNTGIYLLILGSGMIQKELKELVKTLKLEHKIFFHNKVEISQLKSFTQEADFGMNLLEDINLSKKLTVPNKLFEYIHSNIPVVSSNMPEAKDVYDKFNIGKLVNNNEIEIANTINAIVKEDITKYKENCKKAAIEYNWENQEKVIINILK